MTTRPAATTAQTANAPATTAQLRAAFADPPAAFRPMPILHFYPLTNPQAFDWLMERRAGGAVIQAGITPGSKDLGEEKWNNPTYLDDPAQFEALRQAITRLREAGKEVWIYDELGYPSGSAGGRVLEGHPEFQTQVVGARRLRVKAGESIDLPAVQGSLVACYALPVTGGGPGVKDAVVALAAARDISAEGGTWQAPASNDWIVCQLQRFVPDTWRRHNIFRRNVNILDRAAMARFIELTHERYARELGPQLRQITAFFTDEPQFGSVEYWGGTGLPESLPMVQWCDELPDAFRRAKGYDLIPVLPALFLDAGPVTARHRYDFYDVQSDLLAENYFGQIERWCHANGTLSSGHMLLEESLLFHLMFTGSMMKNWARMDLPGVDLLGTPPYKTMAGWNGDRVPVREDFSCKLAASVAHLLGKHGVFTESYALAAKQTSLRTVLGVAAWQFSGGITHMTTYSIQNHLSAEEYAAFSDFAGRLAYLCRRGRPVADVAVLVPEGAIWAAYNPPDGGRFHHYLDTNPAATRIDQVFRDTCVGLLERQRDFEGLDEAMLAQAEITGGKLSLGGMEFPVLVLPEARLLRTGTLKKIGEFLAAGGRVAFVGSLPSQRPERGDDPSVTRTVEALLAAHPASAAHLDAGESAALVDWVTRVAPPALAWEGPAGVRVLERREDAATGGRVIVMVANPAKEGAKGRLTLPAAGAASIWDAETGAVTDAGPVAAGAALALDVPGESARFVVVEHAGN